MANMIGFLIAGRTLSPPFTRWVNSGIERDHISIVSRNNEDTRDLKNR